MTLEEVSHRKISKQEFQLAKNITIKQLLIWTRLHSKQPDQLKWNRYRNRAIIKSKIIKTVLLYVQGSISANKHKWVSSSEQTFLLRTVRPRWLLKIEKPKFRACSVKLTRSNSTCLNSAMSTTRFKQSMSSSRISNSSKNHQKKICPKCTKRLEDKLKMVVRRGDHSRLSHFY